MSSAVVASACSTLSELVLGAQACTACADLASTRNRVVVGHHPQRASLLVVGEAPGALEDETGEPFVGKSGQLLDSVFESAGLTRATIAITSVVKCRPPKNRNPLAGEIAHCSPWLDRQVELINPQVVVALGSIATKWALGKTSKIGQTRGRFIDWRSRQLMVTYHPSAALRFGPNGMPLAAMREDFALVASLLKGTR